MSDGNNPDYWRRIARLAFRTARRCGLSHDDAEDCAVEFEERLARNEAAPKDLDAPGELDMLRQQAWWHVKTYVHQRNRANRGVVYLAQLAEFTAAGLAAEPVSPEPGPEQLAIEQAELEAMHRIIGALPIRKRWLLQRIGFDGVRVVDLEAESGRTAAAIYKELNQTRRLIKARLNALQSDLRND